MKRLLAVLAIALAVPNGVLRAEDESAHSQPLFESEELLHVRITAPLSSLVRDRSDTEYLEGTFAYADASGTEHSLDLKLRARGRYRAQKKTCDFPPVRLNFRKKQVEGTAFAGQDKLKLVTHCHSGGRYEQYVLKEYLAYKIFNTVTDNSFRARLLTIDWVNTERNGKTETLYGFVIEDDDLLAERIGADVVKAPQLVYTQLDTEQASLVAVFEYLIGNTDFSMVHGARDDDCCHNIVPFSREGEDYLVVPYDFDFSGLVNASYASPNPELPIKTVTRRLYRGLCEQNSYVESSLARFREHRAEIRELVAAQEGLTDVTRRRALNYIDRFYEDTKDEKSVDRRLIRRCLSAS